MLRELPFNAIQMTLFQTFKETFDSPLSLMHISDPTIISAYFGLIASTLAALLTQPVDVIKTKLMTGVIALNLILDSHF